MTGSGRHVTDDDGGIIRHRRKTRLLGIFSQRGEKTGGAGIIYLLPIRRFGNACGMCVAKASCRMSGPRLAAVLRVVRLRRT